MGSSSGGRPSEDPRYAGDDHTLAFIEAVHNRFEGQDLNLEFSLLRYRRNSPSSHGQPPFITIRFPKELTDALRFQPVGEVKQASR